MSIIITHLQCEHCEYEYKDIYISFGHPDEEFDWDWKCQECGEVNTYHVGAWPMFGRYRNSKEEV